MASRARIWNAVLVVLSAGNVAAVWFAAQPGEAWHAAAHATLAVAFGLWAQGRMRVGGASWARWTGPRFPRCGTRSERCAASWARCRSG